MLIDLVIPSGSACSFFFSPSFCCCVQLTVTIPRAIKIFFSLRSDMSSHQTAHTDICRTKKKKPNLPSAHQAYRCLMCTHHGMMVTHAFPGLDYLNKGEACLYVPCWREASLGPVVCLFPNGNPLFIINRGRDSTELIYESLFLLFAIQQE